MRIHHVCKLLIVCLIALASLSGMTGCTPGGSSGSGSSGGGTGDQPLLVSLQATDGICPNNGGAFPPFNNTYNNTSTNSPAPVPLADPSCDIASDPLKILGNLEIHLAINTTNAGIDHYDWNISPQLQGEFSGVTNGNPFFAQTFANTITYLTPRMTELYALNDRDHGVFNVTLSSTAFSGDGRFTGGFFNLTFLWPDETQVSASTGGGEISHADATHVADYYYIQAVGAVTIVAVSETNATGTAITNNVLHLYNYNLQQTHVAASGVSGFSRINASLSSNASHYVEVEQPGAAPYFLLVAADQTSTNSALSFNIQKILKIPSPWNGRTYVGRVTELDSFAQPPPENLLSTNVPPDLLLQSDYCYPYADYYRVTGAGITTISATFARPSYCPMGYQSCDTPTNAQIGVSRVYSNNAQAGILRVYEEFPPNSGSLTAIAPVFNTQDQYSLGAGLIYYVELASLYTRNDQQFHPLGTTYTITIGSGTMVPTASPFTNPPPTTVPCTPPGP